MVSIGQSSLSPASISCGVAECSDLLPSYAPARPHYSETYFFSKISACHLNNCLHDIKASHFLPHKRYRGVMFDAALTFDKQIKHVVKWNVIQLCFVLQTYINSLRLAPSRPGFNIKCSSFYYGITQSSSSCLRACSKILLQECEQSQKNKREHISPIILKCYDLKYQRHLSQMDYIQRVKQLSADFHFLSCTSSPRISRAQKTWKGLSSATHVFSFWLPTCAAGEKDIIPWCCF